MPIITLGIKNTFIILLIIVFIIGIYLGISFRIYKMIMKDYNKGDVKLVDHDEPFFKPAFEWFQEIPKEEISITTYDELKLHGYYIPSYNKKSNNIAIVVHGYQSRATDMIIIGKMYAEMGFQVILTDLRGHGESEGDFTSFGFYEKYDLKKWINLALRNYGSTANILIHGVSMGAAATMMVTDLDIPKKNIKFLLLDSGYTKLGKTLMKPKRARFLKVFYPGINMITYYQNKYLISGVKPIDSMKKNTIPFLIVQGDEDTAVSVEMAKKLYNASPAIIKEILVVKGSKHALAFKDEYDLCYKTLLDTIKPIFNIKKIYETKE